MAAPTTATAGDTLSFLTALAAYPANAGWVLTYKLVPIAGNPYTLTCTAEGDAHRATASAATTAAWAPGRYTVVGTVAKAGERYTVEQGTLTLAADLAAISIGLDTRSPACQALEAADEALRTYGAMAYTRTIQIGDRTKQFATAGEFLAYRSRLQAEVAREDARARQRAGGANPFRLYARFGGTR